MEPKDLVGASTTPKSDPPAPSDPEDSDEEVMPSAGEVASPNNDATPAPVAVVEPEPEPEPPDTRQQWECVTAEGPRTRIAGVECPVFRSDDHIVGHTDEHGHPSPAVAVVCPKCGGKSVRKLGAHAVMNENGRAIGG
jgi:hypothetical protein